MFCVVAGSDEFVEFECGVLDLWKGFGNGSEEYGEDGLFERGVVLEVKGWWGWWRWFEDVGLFGFFKEF